MAFATEVVTYFVYGRGLVITAMLAAFFFIASLNGFIRTADACKWVLEKIAFAGGWLLIALMTVVCIEVFGRALKLHFITGALTKYQELEWHLSTAIFSTWMGYNYVINAHPRVDSYTETLSFKRRAWFELLFLIVFAFPYMWVCCHHGWDFFLSSWLNNERSENTTGLEWRWLLKGVFLIGIWLVMLAILSVFLRLCAFLFGGRRQEEVGLQIGHVELEV